MKRTKARTKKTARQKNRLDWYELAQLRFGAKAVRTTRLNGHLTLLVRWEDGSVSYALFRDVDSLSVAEDRINPSGNVHHGRCTHEIIDLRKEV
jgi:hypothetical protein